MRKSGWQASSLTSFVILLSSFLFLLSGWSFDAFQVKVGGWKRGTGQSDILMIWELMSSSEVVSNGQFSFATWPQEGTFLTCQVFVELDFIHQWYITSLCLLISSHLLQMAGSERNHTGSFSQMPMSRLLETMRQPLGEKRKKKKDNPVPHLPQLWLVSLSLFFIILCPYLWLCWVFLAAWTFLLLGAGGYSRVASHGSDFPCCRQVSSRVRSISSCGTWA